MANFSIYDINNLIQLPGKSLYS